MDYLSMGMTNDFEMAIECGANMVRIGTANFWCAPVSDRFAIKHKEELCMGSIKGFIDWVKGEDVEDEYEEELPRQRNEEPVKSSAPSYERSYERSYDRSYDSASTEASSSRRGNKVVNINTTTQLAVVLVKPDRFENAAEIADHLKDKRTVVLNLEQTNKDIARRLVDFLSGVAYANEGKIKKEIKVQSPDVPFVRKGDLVYVMSELAQSYYYVKGIQHTADTYSMTMDLELAEPKKEKASSEKKKDYNVGDIVNFHGGTHYVSSYPGSKGYNARAGKAKITIKNGSGKAHPWHLIHTDSGSNVYGWVDDGTFD